MRTITQQSNPENPKIRKIGVQAIAAALVLAMAFTFNACSGDDSGNDTSPSSSGTEISSSSSGGTDVSSSSGIAHSHDWNDWAETTPATCEDEGEETRTCKGDSLHKETQPITKLQWGEWTVTTPATSTAAGVETRTCPNNASPSETRSILKCGSLDYNPATHGCSYAIADGNIINVILPKCGTSTYDPATQVCRDNQRYDLCGGKEYNAATHGCQSNIIMTKCGPFMLYTPATQFCSSNNIYGKCGGKEYDPATHGCLSGVISPKCNGSTYNPATHGCRDNQIYSSCDGKEYDPITQFCYNNSKVGDFCGYYNPHPYNPDLYQCKPSINANGIYLKTPVLYEGETYEAVLIGTQTWMAKNLNYNASGSKCYNDSLANCTKYGRLYDWATAMGGAASSTASPSGVKGVCPTGWHLPSEAEWTKLESYVGSTVGDKLKARSGWKNDNDGTDGNGTDDYGFSALPGGEYEDYFRGTGSSGYWWSSTESSIDQTRNRYTSCVGNSFYATAGSYKTNFYSVRCVKD